jgi:hypothetical protein
MPKTMMVSGRTAITSAAISASRRTVLNAFSSSSWP